MGRPVELVEKPENKPLHPEPSRGEDHFPFTLADELFQQTEYVRRGVFAVGVHDNHRGGDAALIQVNQSDTQSALVPQIGFQFHTLDLLYVFWWSCRKLFRRCLKRTVIYEDDLTCQCVLAEDGIEPLNKKPSGLPIVKDRDQNR